MMERGASGDRELARRVYTGPEFEQRLAEGAGLAPAAMDQLGIAALRLSLEREDGQPGAMPDVMEGDEFFPELAQARAMPLAQAQATVAAAGKRAVNG